VARDTCRSSGDDTLVSFCDGLYNSCLDPVASTNITTNATSTSTVTVEAFNATAALSTVVLPTDSLRANLSSAATATATKSGLGSGSVSVSAVPMGKVNATGGYVYGGSSSVVKTSSAVVSAVPTGVRNGTSHFVHTTSAAAASRSVDLSGVGKAVAGADGDECEVDE
jgi:hypothetical protein